MKAIKQPQDKTVKFIARSRLASGIMSKVLAAAHSSIKAGDERLMFIKKPIANWTGPFAATDSGAKRLTLKSGDRAWKVLVDKLKLYFEHKPGPESGHAINGSSVKEMRFNRTYQLSVALDTTFGLPYDTDGDKINFGIDDFLPKSILANGTRADVPKFGSAKNKEVEGLRTRKLWSVVKKSVVPKMWQYSWWSINSCAKEHGNT